MLTSSTGLVHLEFPELLESVAEETEDTAEPVGHGEHDVATVRQGQAESKVNSKGKF